MGAVIMPPVLSLAGGAFFIDDTTSYVGIGNTTPASRLDVAGAMYSRMVVASSSAINWNAGNVQSMTLSSNQTLSFSNGQAGGEYMLILKQDATGGRTVSWPASVMWENSTAPTLSSDPNAIDKAQFVFDGTNYLGSFASNYGVIGTISFVNSTSTRTSSSGSSLTFPSFDAGSSDLIVVGIMNWTDNSDSITSVTFDGQSMTRLNGASGEIMGSSKYVTYYYITGQSGVHDIVISASKNLDMWAVVDAYEGVNQATPVVASNFGLNTVPNSTSGNLSLTTTSALGAWVTGVCSTNGNSINSISTATIRESANSYFVGFDSNGTVTPNASYNATCNASSASNYGIQLVEIIPE